MSNIKNKKDSFSYMIFQKDNWPSEIFSYRDILLMDVESKHVAFKNDSTNIFFKLSEQVKYPNTILGIHRTSIIKNEYLRIKNMSQTSCLRAVRFVIAKDNKIWSDNTHWTLAYVYKYGLKTKISDIPLYIIDFRNELPFIYDCDGVVFDSLSDIKKAIEAAENIQKRLDLGWRPKNISYTIGQLYCDIEKIANKND